jgi:hypothetical protein
MTDQNVPAHLLRDRRQIGAEAVQGMGLPPVPYLSIEGNRFTLIDAAGNSFAVPTMGPIIQVWNGTAWVAEQGSPAGPYIDVAMVDTNPVMSRAYYPTGWDPNAQRYLPPICWSDNGEGPSISSTNAQQFKCNDCRWQEWGSKVNQLGHEVKACDDIKKIGFVVPELLAQGMHTVFLLRLKGSSHKNFRNYQEITAKNQIAGRNMDLTDVVTRIYFQPDAIGILAFHRVGLIDEMVANLQDEVWSTDGIDRLLGIGDVPIAHPPQIPHSVPPALGPGMPTRGTEPAPPPQTGWQAHPAYQPQAAVSPPAAAAPPPASPPATSQPAPAGGRRGRKPRAAAQQQLPMNAPPATSAPAQAPPAQGWQAPPPPPAGGHAAPPAQPAHAPNAGSGWTSTAPPSPQTTAAPPAHTASHSEQPGFARAHAPAPAQHGMQAGAPPNADVSAAIANALKLPTPPPPRQ